MELREWATQILSADCLADKLHDPGEWSDHAPGPSVIWDEPTRPPGMHFCCRTREEKLPHFAEHGDAYKRAVCLHRFAGHELLAVEIMAFTLLAFPDAPTNFRRGLAYTLMEEQGHVRLYMEHMARLGVQFGDLPLYRHFWKHTPYIRSPLHYVSVMSLTFEMANLDFSFMYGKSFAHFQDQESAKLMGTILQDEIRHVQFGWQWLKRWQTPTKTEWDTWKEILATTLLNHKQARGFVLQMEPRRQAGISEEWIVNLNSKKHN